MLPRELTITYAQHNQPWTVPYSSGVITASRDDVPHILSSHVVLHASKSVGKLAAVMEKLDHGSGMTTEMQKDVEAMAADLVTAALRLANLHGFNLASVLVERVQEKNGVDLLNL